MYCESSIHASPSWMQGSLDGSYRQSVTSPKNVKLWSVCAVQREQISELHLKLQGWVERSLLTSWDAQKSNGSDNINMYTVYVIYMNTYIYIIYAYMYIYIYINNVYMICAWTNGACIHEQYETPYSWNEASGSCRLRWSNPMAIVAAGGQRMQFPLKDLLSTKLEYQDL